MAGIFLAIISFVIAGAWFLFLGKNTKELSQNKINVSTKFLLVVVFLGLVTIITLFQTSFVFTKY